MSKASPKRKIIQDSPLNSPSKKTPEIQQVFTPKKAKSEIETPFSPPIADRLISLSKTLTRHNFKTPEKKDAHAHFIFDAIGTRVFDSTPIKAFHDTVLIEKKRIKDYTYKKLRESIRIDINDAIELTINKYGASDYKGLKALIHSAINKNQERFFEALKDNNKGAAVKILGPTLQSLPQPSSSLMQFAEHKLQMIKQAVSQIRKNGGEISDSTDTIISKTLLECCRELDATPARKSSLEGFAERHWDKFDDTLFASEETNMNCFIEALFTEYHDIAKPGNKLKTVSPIKLQDGTYEDPVHKMLLHTELTQKVTSSKRDMNKVPGGEKYYQIAEYKFPRAECKVKEGITLNLPSESKKSIVYGVKSYINIAKQLKELKDAENSFTDKEIARCILDNIEGTATEPTIIVSHDARKLLDRVSYLLASTEVSRNKGALIVLHMFLVLILAGEYTIEQITELPMSAPKAVSTGHTIGSVFSSLITNYQFYDGRTEESIKINSIETKKMFAASAKILRSWLEKCCKIELDDHINAVSAPGVVEKILEAASRWCKVKLKPFAKSPDENVEIIDSINESSMIDDDSASSAQIVKSEIDQPASPLSEYIYESMSPLSSEVDKIDSCVELQPLVEATGGSNSFFNFSSCVIC